MSSPTDLSVTRANRDSRFESHRLDAIRDDDDRSMRPNDDDGMRRERRRGRAISHTTDRALPPPPLSPSPTFPRSPLPGSFCADAFFGVLRRDLFPVFSSELGARLGFSEAQLAGVSTLVNAGTWLSVLPGLALDRAGPKAQRRRSLEMINEHNSS